MRICNAGFCDGSRCRSRCDGTGRCASCGAVPCTFIDPGSTDDRRCWHGECRIATVPDERVRARLRLNAEIRSHLLENWGRFERVESRGSKGRNRLARMVRAIRKQGELDLGVAVPALVWGAAFNT